MATARVFISVHVPDTPELDGFRLKLHDHKVTPPEQTHITLKFIGDIDESRIVKVEECIARAIEGTEPFEVCITGTGAFPNTKHPSVIWVGAEPANRLTVLSESITDELKRARIPFDDKPFKPHVTVARCKSGGIPDSLFSEGEGKVFSRFLCDEVLLMKSVLSPKGAKHSVISRFAL